MCIILLVSFFNASPALKFLEVIGCLVPSKMKISKESLTNLILINFPVPTMRVKEVFCLAGTIIALE